MSQIEGNVCQLHPDSQTAPHVGEYEWNVISVDELHAVTVESWRALTGGSRPNNLNNAESGLPNLSATSGTRVQTVGRPRRYLAFPSMRFRG